MPTKIEWTHIPGTIGETWNPVTGCSKTSEGCKFCYAERMARRLAGRHGYPEYPHHFDVTLHSNRLGQPLKWKKPRTVFVVSMGDLFHEDVETDWIAHIWGVMMKAEQHTFQVLTKRPARMLQFVRDEVMMAFPNIWLGITAENQAMADERIPLLLQIPAAVRFVSCEPLLGPIDLTEYMGASSYDWWSEQGPIYPGEPALSWVICGGESGPSARPMHLQWARDLRDQCQAAGIPWFFKQYGAWLAHPEWVAAGSPKFTDWGCLNRSGDWFPLTTTWNGQQGEERDDLEYSMYRVGKKCAGRLLDGREWSEFPVMPCCHPESAIRGNGITHWCYLCEKEGAE